MLVLVPHHRRHALNTAVSHKSKASGFLSALVFENHAIFKDAEVAEVISEFVEGQVVRQPTHEYLSVLRIVHVDCLLNLVDFFLQLRSCLRRLDLLWRHKFSRMRIRLF